MSSATLRFPSWTPPALSSLDFSSDCTNVQAFLQSWFDLSRYKLYLGVMPGNMFNVTFWVPSTVDATATARYFQAALPSDLQAVASYGEILEWERHLRDSYAGAVSEFLRLASGPNQTKTDSLPLDVPYYFHVIDAPSRACRASVCSLSFDWHDLSDLNGPGVFIYYVVLWVIGLIYSVLALVSACQQYHRTNLPPQQQHLDRSRHHRSRHHQSRHHQSRHHRPRRRSRFHDFFATAKASLNGFSDSVAVFSIALPFAIITGYSGGDLRTSAWKHFVLVLWVASYALCVGVWFYRADACIRLAERAKRRATHRGGPRDQSQQPSLTRRITLFFSGSSFFFLLLILIVFHLYGDRGMSSPFHFETFWDGVCGFERLMPLWEVIVAFSLMMGYGALRVGVVELAARFTVTERPQHWKRILGMLDVVVFGAESTAILWCFYKRREELSISVGIKSFRDGWGLGQILALCSLLPVFLGFIHKFYERHYQP